MQVVIFSAEYESVVSGDFLLPKMLRERWVAWMDGFSHLEAIRKSHRTYTGRRPGWLDQEVAGDPAVVDVCVLVPNHLPDRFTLYERATQGETLMIECGNRLVAKFRL